MSLSDRGVFLQNREVSRKTRSNLSEHTQAQSRNFYPDYGYISFLLHCSSVPSLPGFSTGSHLVQDHKVFWKADYLPGLLQLNTYLYKLYPEDRAIPPLKSQFQQHQQPLRPGRQKGLNTSDC